MARRTKEEKQKLRRLGTKLNRIRRNGFFIHMPYAKENEPEVRLWRAVVDRHLKDIVEYILVIDASVNVSNYREAKDWFDDDLLGLGVVSGFACLGDTLIRSVVARVEQQALELKKQGITL